MTIADAIFEHMTELMNDLLNYEHSKEEYFEKIILDLLTNMHQSLSTVDHGTPCTKKQSRAVVLEMWREKCREREV